MERFSKLKMDYIRKSTHPHDLRGGAITHESNQWAINLANAKWNRMMPGLDTAKDLTAWNSQVRWPWGEKSAEKSYKSAGVEPPLAPPVEQGWRAAAAADRPVVAVTIHWTEVVGLAHQEEPCRSNLPKLIFDPTLRSWSLISLYITLAMPLLSSIFCPRSAFIPEYSSESAVQVDDHETVLIEVPGSSGTENENGPIRSSAVQNNYFRVRVPMRT